MNDHTIEIIEELGNALETLGKGVVLLAISLSLPEEEPKQPEPEDKEPTPQQELVAEALDGGININNLALYCNVHRSTVDNWIAGRNIRKAHHERLTTIVRSLDKWNLAASLAAGAEKTTKQTKAQQ